MTNLSDLLGAAQKQRQSRPAEQVRRDLERSGIVRRRCECGTLLNRHMPPRCPECGRETKT